MSAYEERARLLPSVPLTNICVCERMIIRWHTLINAICCSVTALFSVTGALQCFPLAKTEFKPWGKSEPKQLPRKITGINSYAD